MRDAIATTELFAEAPGEPRRSFIIAIAKPRTVPDERGGPNDRSSCRIKMTAERFDHTCEAKDSLHAIADALDTARMQLAALQNAGWRFFESRSAREPFDAARLALS